MNVIEDEEVLVRLPEKLCSVNLLLAIPFLPLNDLSEVFVDLKDEICSEVQPLWQYIDETYVRGVRAWGRR